MKKRTATKQTTTADPQLKVLERQRARAARALRKRRRAKSGQ